MEVIIAAAILAAAYLFEKNKGPKQPASAAVAYAPPAPVSGGYLIGSPLIGNFGNTIAAGAASGALASAIAQPTVLPWASPAIWGGIAGTAGSGGIPLGGPVRPGVSLGTATTVVGPTYINSAPGVVTPKLTAIRPVIA